MEDLSSLSELRKESGNLLWAESDTDHLTDEDIATIAEEFDLHPLAVEDARSNKQRPKLDAYDHHVFMIMHELNEHNDQLEPSQMACFVGDRWVITIHEHCSRILGEAKERWSEAERELESDPSYLVHTLLDVVVDDYEKIADRLEDEVEELEEIVLEVANAPVQRQLYSLNQKLSRMRRFALPLGRVVDWMLGDSDRIFAKADLHLFRDVQDHILRLSDQVQNIDDLTEAVISYTRAEQSASLNEVTKRLTGWAAIIAVPTFIASLYGMNFQLVPNEQELFGFWFALTLMVATGVGLYLYFKRKKWL